MPRAQPDRCHRARSRPAAGAVCGAAILAVAVVSDHAFPGAKANQAPSAPPSSCPAGAIIVSTGTSIADAVAAAPPDAAFCLKKGIYRMQSIEPKPGQKFIGEPGAVLDGARILGGFVRDGDAWAAEDPDSRRPPHGYCARGHPECAYAAGVFIDGRALAEVGSRSAVTPGTFFFDYARHRVVIGDDPAGRVVEAASAEYAFTGTAGGVVIRNLTVEMYRNPAQAGAINGAFAQGWQVENCDIRLNSGAGITVGNDGRVRDSDIHDNGQLGAGGTGTHILYQGDAVWHNNTRMFDRAWEAGGIKLGRATDAAFRGNHVYDNRGPGLWCDVECKDAVFEDNVVERNGDAGIFFEISSGATIRRNVLRENGQLRLSWFWGADIQIAASQDATVCDNRITTRPGGGAIMLIDQNRRRDDGSYNETRDNIVCRNDVEFLGAGAVGGVSDAIPGAHNFAIIENGNNQFFADHYRYQPGHPPIFPWGHQRLDFARFQALGEERGGTITVDEAAAR